MKIVIDIPKEFEDHFNLDRFADSLERILEDITCSPRVVQLSGLYEIETLTMLKKAFRESKPLIQCKDCEHFAEELCWNLYGRCTPVSDMDYCSSGERRESNETD